MQARYNVEIAVDCEEAEAFRDWLIAQGHEARIGRSTASYINGIDTGAARKSSEIMRALWQAYCDAPAAPAAPDFANLILTPAQAEAVYSAMCALNNVGGRLHARLEQDGAVHVAEYPGRIEVYVANAGPVEFYRDQSAFAATYGLQQGCPFVEAPITGPRYDPVIPGLKPSAPPFPPSPYGWAGAMWPEES